MDRDLRRLKRTELVEVIYQQRVNADALEEENQTLKDRLAEAEQRHRKQLAQAQEASGTQLRGEEIEQIGQIMQGIHSALQGIDRRVRDDYRARVVQLEQECEALRNRLDSRLKVQENAGSLAEAVVGLNDIFTNAQQAADQYLAELTARSESTDDILLQAKTKPDALVRDAEETARARMEAAETEIRQKQTEFYAQC